MTVRGRESFNRSYVSVLCNKPVYERNAESRISEILLRRDPLLDACLLFIDGSSKNLPLLMLTNNRRSNFRGDRATAFDQTPVLHRQAEQQNIISTHVLMALSQKSD